MLSALVLDLGGMAFGAVGVTLFVEVAFGIPGLGRTTAQAAVRRDFRVPLGVLLFVAATVAFANLHHRPGRGASQTGRAPRPRADSGVGRYVRSREPPFPDVLEVRARPGADDRLLRLAVSNRITVGIESTP